MGPIWLRALFGLSLLAALSAGPRVLADTAAGLAAYERGDYAAALTLLKPEAEKGDAAAQVKYGLIFAKGLNVLRNPTEALAWFKKAAAQNNAEAQYCMGVAYDIGDTGKQDLQTAAGWYRKAADGGYAKAQFNLGKMLLEGDGIPRDETGAAVWMRRASEQELGDAEITLAWMHLKGLGVETTLLGARYWSRRAVQHNGKDAREVLEAIEESFRKIEQEGVPATDGGDGSSMETAISFPGITQGAKGIKAEHRTTEHFFPGWQGESQGLLTESNGRAYDQIGLTKNGKKRDVYFDVTDWFGILE